MPLISQGVEKEQLTPRTQVKLTQTEHVSLFFLKPISLLNSESIEDGIIIKVHISKPDS